VQFKQGYDSKNGKVEKLENGKLRITYTLQGTELQEEYDTILLAIGREADVKGLGLDNVGVKYNKWNKIVVDDANKTSVDNIWAIGDVIEISPELTPVAIREGLLLVERLFEGKTKKMDYQNVATTIFTPLEYGCVGLSEEKANEKYGAENIDVYHTSFKPLEWNFTNFSKKKPDNLCYCKVITIINENNRVVGLHYVGPNAGEVVQGYAVAVKAGLSWEHFSDTIGIHPTCAEELVTMTITKREQDEVVRTGC